MKGIVFNLLEQAIASEHGEETWDTLLEDADVDGAYTAVGNYPNEELDRLVKAAAEALHRPADEIVRWFGHQALPLLSERYPAFFEGHASTRSFLLTLNEVIHPEVRKLFPGSYAPQFEFDTSRGEDVLVLGYISHRRLCAFGAGLIAGAAEHYGEAVDIIQEQCAKISGERCVFVCRFTSPR